MLLSKPAAPFERLEIRGKSVTIDVDASSLVIPTGNINILPSVNEFSLNPSRVSSAPCGGLSNSIVQDKNPGSLSIEGDSCYLQTIDESYTGKSIGAGKLAETFSITDSGTTGIALATADGVEVEMMDGNIILLSPPSAIVEQFQVMNISSGTQTYTITLKCPATINSIELHNLTSGSKENVTFTKISSTEYTFSKSISGNTTETFQFTIVYDSLNSSQSFSDDANTSIGLENMSESWIAFIPKSGSDIDFIHFSERPKQLELKQNSDGSISQVILYPGNGTLSHGRIKHPNHTKVSGTGYIPDCLNKNMQGSVTKFLQSHGMKTDFPSNATLTTWTVPAISDNKILPLSTISDDLLGDEISLRMCPGEITCASFVIQSDKDIKLEIEASDLICAENKISKDNVDIKIVKCWYVGGNDNSTMYSPYVYSVQGKFLSPHLLIHNDSLLFSDTWDRSDISNKNGNNYMTIDYASPRVVSSNIQHLTQVQTPISDYPIIDTETLQLVTIPRNYNIQLWIIFSISLEQVSGEYSGKICIKHGTTIKNIYIHLNVLPILLNAPNVTYSMYYRGYIHANGSLSSESKTVEQFTAEQIDMSQHGITCPTLYNQSDLIQSLLIREQHGLDNTNLYYLGLKINASSTDITNLVSICDSCGVSNVYVYGYDESNLDNDTTFGYISNIHSLGGKVFCAQSADQSKLANNGIFVASVLDLAIVSSLDADVSALYHLYGNKVFLYGFPQTVLSDPHIYRLQYGLQLWKYNYDGCMDYAYQDSAGDIWNDFDNTSWRDHVVAYPTANGVIDTVKFEGFREAVNDMRYLATLQAAIIGAQTRRVATTDIETWLATLKTTDLSNADLDAIRSQMIDYILELKSSENYSAVLMADNNPILFADGTQLFFLED